MAINLLLDTCILRRLVAKNGVGFFLKKLEFLVKGNHVILLAPEILKKEWEKHREEEREIILKSLKSLEMDARKMRLMQDDSADFFEEKIDDAKRLLSSQLDIIDDLLCNYSKDIQTNEATVLLLHTQKRKNKMPFGSSTKDNYNDAEIIFSALDYLHNTNENVLYFASNNTKEFAAAIPDNFMLHPEISEVFPAVKTHYFTELKDVYQAFEKLDIPEYKESKINESNKIRNTISVDKTKPVLDQLHEYLGKRSDQLAVIPKKILTEHYPIIVSDTFKFYHRPFTLITDNETLFQLLSEVEVEDGVIKPNLQFIKNEEDEKKIKEIYSFLNFNFIESVAFENNDPVIIKYSNQGPQCNCPLCLYKRLSFGELFKTIDDFVPGDSKEPISFKLKHAYVYYKLGNFLESAVLLNQLYDEKKDQKDILTYLICFNLEQLSSLLPHYNWDNDKAAKLGEELKQTINLDNVYKDCRTSANKRLIDWIHEKKFYKDTFSGMHEKVQAITDNFHGQNSGFNDNTRYMIEHYLSTENFLSRNCIIYDVYKEFDSLTNLFTEGLLASYGCSKFLGGRLLYLSDSRLETLMLSGKAEIIKKFYERYKLENIEYKKDHSDGNSFGDLVESVLLDYPVIVENYPRFAKALNDYFWDNYSEMIYNSIALFSIANFDTDAINRFATNLLDFLEKQKHIHNFHLIKHLKFFLFEKRNEISPELLRKYFIAGLKNEFFQFDNYIESVADRLRDRKMLVSLNAEEFQLVTKNFFIDPEFGGSQTWYSIGHIFSVLTDDEQKKEIGKFVTGSLEKKFDLSKYYLVIMFDIIPSRQDFTDSYIEEIEKIIMKGQRDRFFEKKEYYIDSRIDNFFNFCFKYNLDISATIKEHLPKMGAYYIWLNDMESFDYSCFNTDWLQNHFTLYFKRKFRQSNSLKQHLLSLIKTELNKELERRFVLTFCYDD